MHIEKVIDHILKLPEITRESLADAINNFALLAVMDSEIRKEVEMGVGQARARYREKSDAFLQQYREAHKCCPKCGSENCYSTYAGYILNMSRPEEYKDLNKTICVACKHACTTHERVPKKD